MKINFIERSTCPACGAKNLATYHVRPYSDPTILNYLLERYRGKITAEDFADMSYEVLKCESCTMLFQRYVPTDEFAHKIYSYDESRIERSLNKKKKTSWKNFTWNARNAGRIGIMIPQNPYEIKVLDFGAGWGYWLYMAAAYGYDAVGIEISDERVAFARARGLTVEEDISKFEKHSFDFIHCDQTLEHISEPLPMLRTLTEYLAPEGLVYIQVPNAKQLSKKPMPSTGLPSDYIHPLEHVNAFTNKTLKVLAKQAGLVPVSNTEVFKSFAHVMTPTENMRYLWDAARVVYQHASNTNIYFKKK